MEHEIRTSLENVTARLRASIDVELDGLAAELMRAVDAARERARVELDEREAQVRASALAEAREMLQREQAAAATAQASAHVVQIDEREGRLEAVARLLASVRRLDAASSLRETLEVLVQSASLETPRVAVLLIEGSSVRTFAQRGFTGIPDAGPLAAGGIVEAAVRHGQPASTSDPADLKAPGFASLAADRAGFAAPLRVGNRTVAVLYADDAGDGAPAAPAAWPEALELLARHVSVHLENLTATRLSPQVADVPGVPPVPEVPQIETTEAVDHIEGTDDEAAKRYAKLLVSEIKLYNEATVRMGREHRDLRSRLHDEIEHAEQTYLERIPETLPSRREYFEAELVQTLAGGDAAALGPVGTS